MENTIIRISQESSTEMELAQGNNDGVAHITPLNFILSDHLDNVEMDDRDSNVPLTFQGDLEFFKNVNAMQVVFIDPSQVGLLTHGASIITSTLIDENVQDVSSNQDSTNVIPAMESSPSNPLPQKIWSCEECGQTFKKSSELKKHGLQHAKKHFQCPSCTESFNVQKNLELHLLLHNNSSTQCPKCGKKFSRFASFKAHILLHIEDDILTCQYCDNEFETSRALSWHIEEEHRPENSRSKVSEYTASELASSPSSVQASSESAPKTYPCKQCPQQFNTFRALKEHSRLHKKVNTILSCKKKSSKSSKVGTGGPSRYQCSYCSLSFDKPSMKVRHERIHTGERPFKCDLCNRGFSQKNSLICHQKAIHVQEKPYICSLCPYASSQKGNLRAHVRRLHLPLRECASIYRCDDCSAVFRSVSSLTAHMTKFHGELGPTMNSPDSVTPSKPRNENSDPSVVQGSQVLDSHKDDILQKALERSGLPLAENPSSCEPTVPDATDSAVERISSTVVVDRANSCNPMEYVVKYKIVDSVRWLLCPHCTKQFKKPLDLVRHLRIHNSIKPFKCHLCQKIFRLKSTLLAHINSHNGTKDYECESCHKKLASRASLALHKRLHTGQRPYTCQYCNKQFRHRSYFKVHIQAHTRTLKSAAKNTAGNAEESSFRGSKSADQMAGVVLAEPLQVTEQGILQRQPLNSQLFTRADKYYVLGLPFRPYKCEKCGAGFKKSAHLKQHQRTHTGEKPFTCSKCLRNFVSKGVLGAHLLTHERSTSRTFQCTECGRCFSTKGTLNRHMASHSESRPFICPYCKKSFKTYSVCKKHVTTHRNEVAHMQQSLTASTVSDNPPALQSDQPQSIDDSVHFIESNWEMPLEYESSVLDANLPTEGAAVSSDTGDKNASQSLNIGSLHLEENSSTNGGKDGHQYSNLPLDGDVDFTGGSMTDATADTPLYENQVLSQAFPFTESNSVLSELPVVEDLKSKDKKKCPVCDRPFSRISHLKSHLRTHSNEKRLTCTNCDKSFPSKKALTAHEKTHPMDKDSSSTEFQSQSSIQQDAQRDNVGSVSNRRDLSCPPPTESAAAGEEDQFLSTFRESVKPSPVPAATSTKGSAVNLRECPQCSKSFKKPSDLVRHMRIHTGEKPFTCDICDKSFSLKSTLTAHQRTHLPFNKQFTCQECNGLFSCKNTLRIHMRIHSGVKPFKCPECHLCFRTTGHRQSHLKSHRKASMAAGSLAPNDPSESNGSSAANKDVVSKNAKPPVMAHVDIESESLQGGPTRIITVVNDNTAVANEEHLPTIVTDISNLTVKFHLDETGNVHLTSLDPNPLLDLSELFLNQSEGVMLTTADLNLSHALLTERSVSPNPQQELSKNLMNSDSGLRLLAGHQETLLVSGSQLTLQHPLNPSEAEESVGIMLEAVDPSIVLGSQDQSGDRVSVINSSASQCLQ